MKTKNVIALLFLFVINSLIAQEFKEPQLEFVCELKVTIGEIRTLGTTAHGTRKIIPITGGTFSGGRLKGEVLAGGADYQFENLEATRTEIEAIYTIKTDDGVLIHIRNEGVVYKSPALLASLKSGNNVDWSAVYFRAAPKFEAPIDSKYNWLNNAIFICKAVPTKEYVSIQVWQVL